MTSIQFAEDISTVALSIRLARHPDENTARHIKHLSKGGCHRCRSKAAQVVYLKSGRELGCLGIERPARTGGRVERIGQAACQPFLSRPGDHRRVVGAQRERRRLERQAVRDCKAAETIADREIRGDAAGHDKGARRVAALAREGERMRGAIFDHVGDGELERRGHIGGIKEGRSKYNFLSKGRPSQCPRS